MSDESKLLESERRISDSYKRERDEALARCDSYERSLLALMRSYLSVVSERDGLREAIEQHQKTIREDPFRCNEADEQLWAALDGGGEAAICQRCGHRQ